MIKCANCNKKCKSSFGLIRHIAAKLGGCHELQNLVIEQELREQIAKEIEALNITITADPAKVAGLQSASRHMQLRCAAIARGRNER